MTEACRSDDVQPIRLSPLSRQPLISVIVANYNYGKFVGNAITALMAQTYENWQLVVCDDGSTDDSRSILTKWANRDARIKTIFKENGGQSSAWNKAFLHADGEIIALLDADDWFRQDKLEIVVQTFMERPSAGLIYHPLQPADVRGRLIGSPLPTQLVDGWLFERAMETSGRPFPASTSMVFHRDLAVRIFPIPEQVGNYGDMYIGRVASFLTEISAIPAALSFYRFHENNHSARGVFDLLCQETLAKWIEAHILTFSAQQHFLRQAFDEDLAVSIHLEDTPELWDMLGRLYLLEGKPATGIMGYEPSVIREGLENSKKRYMWRLCFAVPHPWSLWILRAQIITFQVVRLLRRHISTMQNRFTDKNDQQAKADITVNNYGGSKA